MRRTGLLFDRRFQDHDTGSQHPESSARTSALCDLFESDGFADFERIAPRLATEEELGRVHEPAHLEAVAASARRVHTLFDADTPASAGSFEAARLAAGGAIAMADAILARDIDNGFAALRPPGHHAEAERPMGFCLFNNVAVVAQHLMAVHGLQRVLIVDWDVHHGNGTQNSFYGADSVMFASTHQYPFYPGTGAATEIGLGAGEGFTVNVPMLAGAGDDDYHAAFHDLLLPIARQFAPEFVLVSAGFDAHRDDPLASISLSTEAFAAMTDAMTELADETAAGRLMLLLEGGYDVGALTACASASTGRLRKPEAYEPGGGELSEWGRFARQILAGHWAIA